MPLAKLRDLLRSWALALAVSAALVAAGEHWPEPLPYGPPLVWTLVLVPPGVMAVLLVLRWRLPPREPAPGDGGESGERAQETR